MKKLLKNSLLTLMLMFALTFAMNLDVFAASAPKGLKQIDDSSSSISVSWDAVIEPNVYGYKLYYAASPNGPWVALSSDKYDTTSTNDSIYSLSAGKSYWVRVATVTRTESGYSYVYSEGTAGSAIEVVTAPYASGINMVQTNATTSGVTVRIDGVTGANNYVLTYNDIIIGESSTNTITSKANLLAAATKYWVDGYACRKSASGYRAIGSYDYNSVTTLSKKIKTNSFGVVNIWANINCYNFGAVLGDGGDADGLEFQFMRKNGKSKKIFSDTSSTVSVDRYINGTFRKYRVRSYVVCNGKRVYSAWSDYKYIGVPKTFNCRYNNYAKQIKLSWSKVKDASRYVVYISKKENSGWKKVKTLKSNKRSITISKYGKSRLKKGTYYVKVVPQVKVGKKYKNSEVVWTSKVTFSR